MIKKIVYNLEYSCFGVAGTLYRKYYILKKNKISFRTKFLDSKIRVFDIDFDRLDDSYEIPENYDLNITGDYSFEQVCDICETICKEHKQECLLLDVTPASIVMYYDDKSKKIIKDLGKNETKELDSILSKYHSKDYLEKH